MGKPVIAKHEVGAGLDALVNVIFADEESIVFYDLEASFQGPHRPELVAYMQLMVRVPNLFYQRRTSRTAACSGS